MTPFCKGIVDSFKNLKFIYKAMKTKKFIDVMNSSSMSFKEIDIKVIKTFKKDFWKYFVDENGNEI